MEEVSPISAYEGFQCGNFRFEYIGKGLWRGKYNKIKQGYIALDVNEEITIPFKGWRLVRVDCSFDDATSKDIYIRYYPEGLPKHDNPPVLDSSTSDTETSYSKGFGENYEFILGDVLNIYIDGTASKLATPIITVQQLRGLKKPPEQPLTTTEVEEP